MPLVIYGYDVGAKPSTFAHMLSDMLLPQSVEAQSAKPVEFILYNSAGYSFHVSSSVIVFLYLSSLYHNI